ncbi:cytochrome P450 family [Rhizoctonia solani]|nr:cytochrome P450 family [Rhizoctonia solani]
MIVDWIPFGPVRELRDAVDIVDNVATKVYRDKRNELGKTPLNVGSQMSRDVMSSLCSIVSSEEAMNEEELISQVNAVTIAAHDSTSTALARTIYILAQFPEFQSQLREEVREAHEIHGEQLNYDQLNSLPFLDAVCRESLRLYAPGLFLVRVAQENCSIPLLYPARPRDKKGEMTRVFVDKGTYIYLSLDGANRDLRTWGEDANVFRPSRWLDSTPSNLHGSRMPGIYSSLWV